MEYAITKLQIESIDIVDENDFIFTNTERKS